MVAYIAMVFEAVFSDTANGMAARDIKQDNFEQDNEWIEPLTFEE